MKKSIYLLLMVIIILAARCSPSRFTVTRLSITEESTIPVTIIVYGVQEPNWDEIFNFLEARARLYDHRIEGSPIHSLNMEFRATVPDEVYRVIALGLDIAKKSNGSFDPTILPLTQLWNFDSDPHIPPRDALISALDHVDYTKVTLLENNTIKIPQFYGLDLGGIAKGAIVDTLADYLAEKGYEQYLIEAGGDILVSGLKPSDKKWGIGIMQPRDKNNFIGELSIGNEAERTAVVTSGDYERFFKENGKTYHHILDPHTGYPAEELTSVTVIAPTCTEADALATAVFVLGQEEGLMLLEHYKNAEGLLVYQRENKMHIVMTEHFSTIYTSR